MVQTYVVSLDDNDEEAMPTASILSSSNASENHRVLHAARLHYSPLPHTSLPRRTISSSSGSSSGTSKSRKRLRRVRVAVRCRPMLCREERRAALDIQNGKRIELNGKSFAYDSVFGPAATQSEVYNCVGRPIVEDVMKGYNGAIMAYGQTGTGKTYTMGILDRIVFSSSDHVGIIPSSLGQIFQDLHHKYPCSHGCSSCSWTVSLSFLQIYLESLQDLLAPLEGGRVDEGLTMREDPKTGFYVQGLRSFKVKSLEEAIALVNLGLENRNMACTSMNTSSSRSHTVLTVEVVMSPCQQNKGFSEGNSGPVPSRVRGKLRLIDLAGSERVKTGSVTGTRAKESRSINVSLSALGNVVAALAQRESVTSSSSSSSISSCGSSVGTDSSSSSCHVPFRDSKLTRLLQDTLGGKIGANTALVATIGPNSVNLRESLSTLQFASRCMRVRSEARAQREVNYADLCASLQSKLENCQREFMNREDELRRHYEKEISTLRGGDNTSPTGYSPIQRNTEPLFYEMYSSFMDLGREYRSRLNEQRSSLEAFVHAELPGQSDLSKLRRTLNSNCGSNIEEEVVRRLGHPVSSRLMQQDSPLPPGSEPDQLALHARVAMMMLKLEAEQAHVLLNKLMSELISLYIHGAKRDEDLLNCSHVLKYLLKTNAQLRSDLSSNTSTSPKSAVSEQPPPSRSTKPLTQLDRFLMEHKEEF